MNLFRSMKLVHWFLLALVATTAACATPYPGYRHEGETPDERLLALVDRHYQLQDPGTRDANEEKLLVDGGRALNELRRLHLDYPFHVPTLYTLAAFNYERGYKEIASGYLDTLFSIEAAHPEAGILRTRISIADGNLPAARRVLSQQIRYRPDHAGLREAASCVAFLDGELEEAVEELEMARRLGSPEWRIAFNLGLIEEATGNLPRALEMYEIALEENPEFEAAASRKAGLRAFSGETVR